MKVYCGLENEAYKYVHGVYVKDEVPFDRNKSLKLTCGKNDWAVAQLLLYSKQEMMVCVNEDTCFYQKGSIETVRVQVDVPGIDKGNVEVSLVGLVEDDDKQLKSDIILKQQHIYVEPKKVQQIWIEIKTDKDTIPGTYKANITLYSKKMFEDEKIINTLSYQVEVLNVLLDEPKDYKFYLDLWQHNSNIARKYDVALWSEKHFEFIENYVKSLVDLGQKAISVVVSEIPWSGQHSAYDRINSSDLFEYNIVKVVYTKSGRWQYDFFALNRYIQMCMNYGINKEIEVFGLSNIWLMEDMGYGRIIDDFNDGIRIRYYDECDGTYKFIRNKNDLNLYVKALENNFIDKGWIDKVRIIADEPADLEEFKEKVNILRNMAPNFKFKVAINHVEFMGHNITNVVDYCPSLPCICDKYEELLKVKEKVKGKISYYVCCGPKFPNTFIRSPFIEARIIPWIAWYLGLDGFLRWNYTVWPDEPLRQISYRYPGWPAGDTNFVYPGKDGMPLLTIRYKNLKRGIRDYEIIRRYSEQEDSKEKVFNLLKKVFIWENIRELNPKFNKMPEELYSLEYNKYEEIINRMIKKIK